MKDLLELAAKCRNPIVRNAILANAATGRGEELAERLARVEIRSAKRDAEAARAEHARIFAEAVAQGEVGKGNRRFVDPMIAELSAISDADARATRARRVVEALRRHEGGNT